MNTLVKNICLLACLLSAAFAMPNSDPKPKKPVSEGARSGNSNSLKNSQWSFSEMESMPNVNEITMEQLETLPTEKGAKLVDQLYHLTQIRKDIEPDFTPSPSNIKVLIVHENNEQWVTLNNLANTVKQDSDFGDDELTVLITGLPKKNKDVEKALNQLVDAYKKRYSRKNDMKQETSNEKEDKPSTGNLVVVELGETLNSFKRLAKLDVEKTGAMIGQVLAQMSNSVPYENIHVIGQGIGAQVAGAAGRQFSRRTGHQLRRITGLDPMKIFAKNPGTLTGLARGDADFVDAIHTSSNGIGTKQRCGDADFYPNGPNEGAPGADNIISASMKATKYFAETVAPGNERNFPAIEASSMEAYKNKNSHGMRVLMGINTPSDARGDYMLEVNPQSPYGKKTSAKKNHSTQ